MYFSMYFPVPWLFFSHLDVTYCASTLKPETNSTFENFGRILSWQSWNWRNQADFVLQRPHLRILQTEDVYCWAVVSSILRATPPTLPWHVPMSHPRIEQCRGDPPNIHHPFVEHSSTFIHTPKHRHFVEAWKKKTCKRRCMFISLLHPLPGFFVDAKKLLFASIGPSGVLWCASMFSGAVTIYSCWKDG